MHNYPSDISRKEFEIIREELEGAKKKTKPRQIDLYDVFCAVLYVVKGGIQWRMLPSDFPKWQDKRMKDNLTLKGLSVNFFTFLKSYEDIFQENPHSSVINPV